MIDLVFSALLGLFLFSPIIFKRNSNYFKAVIFLWIFFVAVAIAGFIFMGSVSDYESYSGPIWGEILLNIGFMIAFGFFIFVPLIFIISFMLLYTYTRNKKNQEKVF